MDSRDKIKEEFTYYLANVARSSRRTEKGYNLQKTAVQSFLSFLEVEKLFDYDPGKWKHIESMYDITDPTEVCKVSDALINDEKFVKHDNDKNQGWRSGSIIHYACFIKARSYFMNVKNEESIAQSDKPESAYTGILSPLQQIFYGAPGTGKSHNIYKETKGEDVIRTTFHPDSDYSSFVGAYKPTTTEETVMAVIGTKAVPVENPDGTERKETKIVYEFVSQAFLQAYVEAWKKYAIASEGEPKKQFLVIEEINRGNCAQIFGDLFQLLDRNDYGFSDYPIKADADMKRHLAKAFTGLSIAQADSINSLYDGRDMVKEVLEGDILLLPNNLFIWATMNTSDQSLFPIDSAFKRRWDWQYMPIDKGYDCNGQEIEWEIEGKTKNYSWWSFLEKINDQIGDATQSEDKKLGFFFCKAADGIISAEKFVGKVIFYLWNDVFKNNGFESPIFRDADGSELSFGKFYKSDTTGNAIVQKDKVELFLNNLGVEASADGNTEAEENEA